MKEMQPWLDNDHIRKAHLDDKGHFVLHFQDGMKNVYDVDDCSHGHVEQILKDLAARGISTTA